MIALAFHLFGYTLALFGLVALIGGPIVLITERFTPATEDVAEVAPRMDPFAQITAPRMPPQECAEMAARATDPANAFDPFRPSHR